MTVSVHGLPPLMREGLRLAVVPPPLKEDRWHVVRSVASGAGSGDLVSLSGVDDIGAAQALVGTYLLAKVTDLPADYALHDVDALLGREVVDERLGVKGIIDEVLRGPANDVWSIRPCDDADEEPMLLPVIDEVVRDVPVEGPIPLCIPAGLEPSWRAANEGSHQEEADQN